MGGLACLSLNLSAVYLVFRFLAGVAGAAFLSVAGGSIADIYDNASVAKYVIPILPL